MKHVKKKKELNSHQIWLLVKIVTSLLFAKCVTQNEVAAKTNSVKLRKNVISIIFKSPHYQTPTTILDNFSDNFFKYTQKSVFVWIQM